ncbi:winged helix-turn-helix transcriptional regulator [Ruegeria sediminis]|uniref:Winged helix-turn-helix transcriptional regulator n=1 Tax=Ruegeria sediminis TaxID=2583820 RepID=A0ABY2X0B8_9RHOB|nr:MarR family winged helix-turn-helix transcriptional regulator [Ruegeria sediminis]TMV08681.1 winged helix-turn-helix transcriptional regulator [Ruegeria sediminis]
MPTQTFSNDSDRRSFRSIFAVCSKLRDIDENMPLQQALVFLWAALNEGKTQVDLRRDLDMLSSTASRNLAALSKVHRLGKPGLNLIEWVENPEDRRAKLIYLTVKGRQLASKLLEPLS